ncbi:hypothetical protein [Actinophytocola sp.]|uniref:hypothetical protein n=1 Tax=Actinophytocola sp. TaxID=1872138 RepID=UPI002ED15489
MGQRGWWVSVRLRPCQSELNLGRLGRRVSVRRGWLGWLRWALGLGRLARRVRWGWPSWWGLVRWVLGLGLPGWWASVRLCQTRLSLGRLAHWVTVRRRLARWGWLGAG